MDGNRRDSGCCPFFCALCNPQLVRRQAGFHGQVTQMTNLSGERRVLTDVFEKSPRPYILEMTFMMKRSRDALLSVSEMRKSGQMPMANRTEVLTDNNMTALVNGRDSRFVSRKYFGNVPNFHQARGPVNTWHEIVSAAASQILRGAADTIVFIHEVQQRLARQQPLSIITPSSPSLSVGPVPFSISMSPAASFCGYHFFNAGYSRKMPAIAR